MQGLVLGPDTLIHALTLGITAAVAWVGYKIKISVGEAKAELLEKSTAMRVDMDKKHAENSQSIAVHAAEDVQKFAAISQTLTRIEGKLDYSLNGK